jgi:hypothetical protein
VIAIDITMGIILLGVVRYYIYKKWKMDKKSILEDYDGQIKR